MAQYTLDGNEKRIEVLGIYASIKNNSDSVMYASGASGIDPAGEGVTPIQPGESVVIPASNERSVFVLGAGDTAVLSGNKEFNFFKPAPTGKSGGGGDGITEQQLNDALKPYATTASVDTKFEEYATEFADLKGYIGYTDSDIYGLEADFENNKFTRLAGATEKAPGTDFDSIKAFDRRRCNLSDNGEVLAYYGESTYTEDGSNGQVMVEQPAFYYKVVPIKTEKAIKGFKLRKARYYVSDTPKAGFKLHPAFIKNGIEIDKIYLSAYEGCIYDASAAAYLLNDEQVTNFDADMLSSIANAKPVLGATQNLTRTNSRKLAHNRGEGWEISLVQTISVTQLLFAIEYATFNSQIAIGNGVVNAVEAINTGSTSSLGNASGSVANSGVSFRGEENLWGNTSALVDGMNEENPVTFESGDFGTLYVANHGFVDDSKAAPYKNTGIHPIQGSGFISAFGYSEEFDWLFIPVECTGNSALPIGDHFWNISPGWRVAVWGGRWDYATQAGVFSLSLNSNSSYHGQINSRLVYIPSKTEEVTTE